LTLALPFSHFHALCPPPPPALSPWPPSSLLPGPPLLNPPPSIRGPFPPGPFPPSSTKRYQSKHCNQSVSQSGSPPQGPSRRVGILGNAELDGSAGVSLVMWECPWRRRQRPVGRFAARGSGPTAAAAARAGSPSAGPGTGAPHRHPLRVCAWHVAERLGPGGRGTGRGWRGSRGRVHCRAASTQSGGGPVRRHCGRPAGGCPRTGAITGGRRRRSTAER
jgi:hypothetical protein